ncbi:MAG: dihydroorotase, partial [Actinomycetota bacterium]
APLATPDPGADAAAVVHVVRAAAASRGLCDVYPVGAVTRGLAGAEMAELGELYEAGVRVFSDDGHVVPNARVLRNALTYLRAFPGAVFAEHAEDPTLGEGAIAHEGLVSATLGLASVPREAEEIVVARDIALARLTGGRVHVCHLSSAGSVDLVRRARAEGVPVTAEVTPHHLAMTDASLTTYDANLRVNPPLRAERDRDALRAGLADGTIDAVATDHAPHAPEEKEVEFDLAPPGTIGLETALAVVLTDLVHPGLLDLPRAIAALSTNPARILGATGHGGPIEPGAPANLVLVDPEATWTVAAPFASRSRNSAFLGRTLRGRVVATFLRGEAVVLDGEARR